VIATLTAGEVISRVKANLGIPWRDTTYRDTFKFGGPDTEVRGIATAMFCNLDVLKAAVAADATSSFRMKTHTGMIAMTSRSSAPTRCIK